MYREDAKKILERLTLEEKAALTSGAAMFETEAFLEKDVEKIVMADGPHGLRKQEGSQDFMGKNESVTATCFPAACAVGSSFDAGLATRMAEMLAKNCKAQQVDVLLGPGINIKRSPLCGRNFEYFSEDPYVAGTLGTAYVKALQENGVGASLKHFFANNQEARRRTSDSRMSERTMREIYLAAFEQVVKEAHPWTVMAAYNKVDGVYMTENRKYLRKLLGEEWGFDGLVISDWAAVHDRIAAVIGGCGLTMPGDSAHDRQIVEAVENGTLPQEDLDLACLEILTLMERTKANRKNVEYDLKEGHDLAVEIAKESMVLLKNEGDILPLDPQKKILIVGGFATEPRYQGAGSSRVNPYLVRTMPEVTEGWENVTYAEGFDMTDTYDPKKCQEVLAAAEESDVVVVMAGLPPIMESEGFDRYVMKLPDCQNRLIHEIAHVQKNLVVVLENGGAVELPWEKEAAGILEAYLLGEGCSEAIWSVLTGETNPSGHLAETFPLRIEDVPCYLYWPGEGDRVTYDEGVFVGYRYYSSTKRPVLYPFGHGLSYTRFSYSDLSLERDTFAAGETLQAKVTVKNEGDRAGKALVQLYVGCSRKEMQVHRPIRELRRFQKVELLPGESKEVTFTLDKRCFAYWDESVHDFRIHGGNYTIEICQDAQTVLLSKEIAAEDEYLGSVVEYSIMTPLADVEKHPVGRAFLDEIMPTFNGIIAKMGMNEKQMSLPYPEEVPKEMGLLSEPLQTIQRMLPMVGEERWEELFKEMNKEVKRG